MSGFIISGYKPLYTHYFDRDYTFTFENYVNSQLHLDIIPRLYQRDPYNYLKALKYLGGKTEYADECGKVLKYFYTDMTNMLCNVLKKNPEINNRISIVVDIPRNGDFPVLSVNLDDTIMELRELIDTGSSSAPGGIGPGVFTLFNSVEMSRLVPNETLALASILSYHTGNEIDPTILEVF
jgi:hypothetical protein